MRLGSSLSVREAQIVEADAKIAAMLDTLAAMTPEQINAVGDLLLKITAPLGATVVFLIGLWQYRQGEAWKRAEWVAQEIAATELLPRHSARVWQYRRSALHTNASCVEDVAPLAPVLGSFARRCNWRSSRFGTSWQLRIVPAVRGFALR